MKFINEFVGSWIVLGDFTFLLNYFSNTAEKILYQNKMIILNTKLKEIETFHRNNSEFSKQASKENIIKNDKKIEH